MPLIFPSSFDLLEQLEKISVVSGYIEDEILHRFIGDCKLTIVRILMKQPAFHGRGFSCLLPRRRCLRWSRGMPQFLGGQPGLGGLVADWVGGWVMAVDITKWVFPKIGVPQNGWFIMENPIKMDDLRVPPFKETPKWSSNLENGAVYYCWWCRNLAISTSDVF